MREVIENMREREDKREVGWRDGQSDTQTEVITSLRNDLLQTDPKVLNLNISFFPFWYTHVPPPPPPPDVLGKFETGCVVLMGSLNNRVPTYLISICYVKVFLSGVQQEQVSPCNPT